MADERQVWLTLPEGKKPEDDRHIASLLSKGWVITDSSDQRMGSGREERRLWVVRLLKSRKEAAA